MRFIKGVLVGLSLLQYIIQPSFWKTDFYWLFLWIIAFNLLWFYIEKLKYRKVMLGIIGLLGIVNILTLPDLPIALFALFTIDVRTELSRKQAGIFLGSMLVIVGSIWSFFTDWPPVNTVILFLAFLSFAWWSAEQGLVLKDRNERHYEYRLIQNEMEEKADLLKAQMQSMEEVYTLNERNRISRDLHDSVGHTLSTIVIQTAALEKLTEHSSPEASNMLNELHHFSKKGLSEVRSVIHALKPSKYDRIAFFDQINSLIKEYETNSNLQVYFNRNDMLWALNDDQEQLLFRAIQEFLVNTTKHSQASEVRIQQHFTDRSIILTMQDNGVGTDNIKPQMGLTGMEERAKLLGGKVSIQSSINAGFKVRIVLPKGGYGDV